MNKVTTRRIVGVLAGGLLVLAACGPTPGGDDAKDDRGGAPGTDVVTLGTAETAAPGDVAPASAITSTDAGAATIATLAPLSGKLEPVVEGGPMVAVELKDAFKPMPARPAGTDPVPAEDQPALEDFFVKVADVEAGIRAGMDIVWLDARDKANFDFGHIPGAVNAPYFEVADHTKDLPRDRWIVSYCECPHHESGEAAMGLWNEGYTYIRVLEEGLAGWRDGLKMPVESTN